jgi:hypothetical protein
VIPLEKYPDKPLPAAAKENLAYTYKSNAFLLDVLATIVQENYGVLQDPVSTGCGVTRAFSFCTYLSAYEAILGGLCGAIARIEGGGEWKEGGAWVA